MPRNFEFEELLKSLSLLDTPSNSLSADYDDETPPDINTLHAYLLLEIFSHLSLPELRPLISVCSEWRDLILEYLPQLWCSYHGVAKLIGTPRSPDSFFSPQLVLSHRRPVTREDNLLRYALQFNVNVGDLMRFNNLISEQSLYSRDFIFIPVTSPEDKRGAYVTFEYSERARREFCRIVPESERESLLKLEEERAAAEEQLEDAEGTPAVVSQTSVDALRRALRIDDAQARYYLVEAGGNLKRAIELWKEDQDWESHEGKGGLHRVHHRGAAEPGPSSSAAALPPPKSSKSAIKGFFRSFSSSAKSPAAPQTPAEDRSVRTEEASGRASEPAGPPTPPLQPESSEASSRVKIPGKTISDELEDLVKSAGKSVKKLFKTLSKKGPFAAAASSPRSSSAAAAAAPSSGPPTAQ